MCWERERLRESDNNKLLAKWHYCACGRCASRFAFPFGVESAVVYLISAKLPEEGGWKGGLVSGDVGVTWMVTNGSKNGAMNGVGGMIQNQF